MRIYISVFIYSEISKVQLMVYFCAQKVEKKNILIIYATRRTAERSDAATCKNQAQAEGFGGEKPCSLRGGGVRSQNESECLTH